MRVFSICLWVTAFISCNNSQKEDAQSKGISRHSNSFNSSVQSAMERYHALTEAFVNWDSVAVIRESVLLERRLDSVNFYGFNPESVSGAVDTLTLAKKDLKAMALNKNMTDKRHDLNSLTEHLYDFLEMVQYDEKKIYLQECPMAFHDTIPGVWLSETEDIRNPYLGLHHPKYGKAMIDCGGTKSTIDFTAAKEKK